MADITYCGLSCDNTDCERNQIHIIGDGIPHSVAFFNQCERHITKSQYKRIKIQQESEEQNDRLN